jgi:F-type H+-transporting ATPase subunit epsilon
LSQLRPGEVIVRSGDEQDCYYINSGTIEVQPHVVTILADTCIRSKDLDESQVLEAKRHAEEAMENAKGEVDIARAQVELAEAVAQIQTITKLRERLQKTGMA